MTPETFKSTATFGQFFMRQIIWFVPLFLVGTILFGALAGVTGVPGALYVGVVLSALFCSLMAYAKKRQFDQKWSQQAVTFSPAGAVMSDRDTRVELPWARVQSIGEVQLMAPLVRPPLYWGLPKQGPREHGLVGAGLLTTTPEAPMVVKTQVQQFLNDGEADPQIGQRPMGIPLARFDMNWQNGRIGQWVRTYRPDLLAAVQPEAPASSAHAPGWQPDPYGQARLRWWDGARWSEHTAA